MTDTYVLGKQMPHVHARAHLEFDRTRGEGSVRFEPPGLSKLNAVVVGQGAFLKLLEAFWADGWRPLPEP